MKGRGREGERGLGGEGVRDIVARGRSKGGMGVKGGAGGYGWRMWSRHEG